MATEKAPDVTPAAPLDQTISIDPKIAVSDQHDVAAKILAENGDALNGTFSAEEDRKLRWKLDWHLIPVLSICATLNGIDKVSISTAALYGLREDTHLVGSKYSWVGSIIYFGGLLAVLPTSWAIHRFPIGKYYALNIIAWGAIQMIMASCTNYGGLMVCRFLLGGLEACSTPCITIMYTMFYKKSEQPLRNTITFGSTSIETWKWLFIVLGGVTVIFGTWIFFYLPSNPGDARWLSDKEKAMVVLRVRENQTGIENKIWKWYHFKEAMFDYKTWLLFFYIIGVTVPNGGLNTFNGLVIKNLGFTSHTTTLLQMPTGMFSTLAALVASFFAMRTIRFRTLIMAVVLLYPSRVPHSISRMTRRKQVRAWQANTAGHTKKVTISYTMYVAYAIGNIIGPQTFIANQAPKYTGGIVAMLVCYCVCICLALALGFAYFANNKRRGPDMIGAEHSESEFLDLTDKENKSFKYTS